jgi:hypothetical protein
MRIRRSEHDATRAHQTGEEEDDRESHGRSFL